MRQQLRAKGLPVGEHVGYSWQYSQGKKSEGGWKSERRGGSTVRLKAPIHSGITVEIVVVAFSSLPRILGECSTIFRLHFFFFFLKWRLAHTH